MSRRLVPALLLCSSSLALVACKGGRRSLEQLVPDGATGLVSVDAKGLLATELYGSGKTMVAGLLPDDAKASEVLAKVRDECEIDLEKAESLVVGFDLISKNVMGAVRVPNVGKVDALRCLDEAVRAGGGSPSWEIGETDGKATISFDDGEVQAWAMDSSTLVLSTKGWSSAVQSRMKGESKGAVDNSLKEAVALADRGKHVWFAGQVPAIMESFLTETPVAGLRRVAGSMDGSEGLALAVALELADEGSAKALEEVVRTQFENNRSVAVAQGVPKEIMDSFELELDGAVLRSSVSVSSETFTGAVAAIVVPAFEKYTRRSKTSEARVELAKMVDAASAYFQEEHVERGATKVLGVDAALAELAAHGCPNDGRAEGEAGMTPPLSVDCSEGPAGRCVPSVDGKDGGPGYYDIALFADNPVWSAMNFQLEQGHYFHYNFRWKNDPSGYGACQFTAQAFGDLDGDGMFSTYERAGMADRNGVAMAAGLYIDREVE